jgi:hypothetical protein
VKNNKFIFFKFLIIIILFFNNQVIRALSLSDEFDNPDFEFNAAACTMDKKNDLGVCIENQTNEDITAENFYFSQYFVNKNGSETEDSSKRIEKNTEPNKLINIQFSRERFSHHNPTFRPAQVKISLRRLPNDTNVCSFVWHELSPPYAKPVRLILSRADGQYGCRWEISDEK